MTKVFKFYSKTCVPCKALTKQLETAGIVTTDIDVDSGHPLIREHNVMSVPTVVVLDNEGEFVGKVIGAGATAIRDIQKLIARSE